MEVLKQFFLIHPFFSEDRGQILIFSVPIKGLSSPSHEPTTQGTELSVIPLGYLGACEL